ncbi:MULTISPECIES: hypothetical protein [unclassified Streptomyces]|uniref:hypothetical protein n=1 Tax=unclassified Streptomyces TaxID=2593676 RepID=UPI0033206E43
MNPANSPTRLAKRRRPDITPDRLQVSDVFVGVDAPGYQPPVDGCREVSPPASHDERYRLPRTRLWRPIRKNVPPVWSARWTTLRRMPGPGPNSIVESVPLLDVAFGGADLFELVG